MSILLNRNRFLAQSHLQAGVTLVELMVALVIGLIVSLAVYSVLNASEGRKRTTTSISDIDKAGAYGAFQLDKAIRSAGSGFSGGVNSAAKPPVVASNYSYGCRLIASTAANNLLPSPNTFPVPFNNVPQTLRLAPLLILDGQSGAGATGGDVLISMIGGGGVAESLTNFTAAANGGSIPVQTTAGLTANDLILLMQTDDVASAGAPIYPSNCLIDQVAANFMPGIAVDAVNLGGTFHANAAINAFNRTSVIANLGRTPQFNMFSVGANNTLFRYDLLAPASADNPAEFVDSVIRMEAIYGISNNAGGLIWQAPSGGFFDFAALTNGTQAANANLRSIVMVRVALIMQTAVPEKVNVSPAAIPFFQGTGVNTQDVFNVPDRRFRYRVIEASIPIRNALIGIDDLIQCPSCSTANPPANQAAAGP